MIPLTVHAINYDVDDLLVDAKILGVVLNKVTDNRKEYNSYYG